MTELTVAVVAGVLLVAAGLAWDVLRKRGENEHARLLAHDRYQEVQRTLTTLELRVKGHDVKLEGQLSAIDEFYIRFAKLKEQRTPMRDEFEALEKLVKEALSLCELNNASQKNMAMDLVSTKQKMDGLLLSRTQPRLQGRMPGL